MPFYTDQIAREIYIGNNPTNIISIVPSQTELLYDLGLDKEVTGITKFCIHPNHWRKSKTIIGGTKNIRLDLVNQLNPDLIIANKEENTKEQIDALLERFPVWVSDITTLDDAVTMIRTIGEITGKSEKATEISKTLSIGFNNIKQPLLPQRAAYLIWKNPYMAAGGNTFINTMMAKAGFQNVFEQIHRYPEVTIEQISKMNCNNILLSSEPYPFKQQHIHELKELLPDANVILVDGEIFSWYGSRLLKAPDYFNKIQQYF